MGSAEQGDFDVNLRMAFALCGLQLRDDRLQAMAAAHETVRVASVALATVDFGDAEPATRFRAPSPRLERGDGRDR